MGEVKRYDPDSSDATLREYVGGEWVTYIDYATLEAEREALRAKVAKLSAAAAQMREALHCAIRDGAITIPAEDDPGSVFACCGVPYPNPHAANCFILKARAALSTDAGKGYVDASGAVEAKCIDGAWPSYGKMIQIIGTFPDAWAGRTVLVMVKP